MIIEKNLTVKFGVPSKEIIDEIKSKSITEGYSLKKIKTTDGSNFIFRILNSYDYDTFESYIEDLKTADELDNNAIEYEVFKYMCLYPILNFNEFINLKPGVKKIVIDYIYQFHGWSEPYIKNVNQDDYPDIDFKLYKNYELYEVILSTDRKLILKAMDNNEFNKFQIKRTDLLNRNTNADPYYILFESFIINPQVTTEFYNDLRRGEKEMLANSIMEIHGFGDPEIEVL